MMGRWRCVCAVSVQQDHRLAITALQVMQAVAIYVYKAPGGGMAFLGSSCSAAHQESTEG